MDAAKKGRTYVGVRETDEGTLGGAKVMVVDGEGRMRPLPPRNDLRNHSPDGFNWGYGGSGPAQLALAILADHLGDDGQALRWYQPFKRAVVALLPESEGWTVDGEEIQEVLRDLRRDGP